MAYIVVNNDNVTIKRNLKQLNKKLKTKFTKEEFKKYNNNYIMNITNDDLDYKRDVHELNRVFVSKLYKKDNGNLIIYGFLIMLLLLLVITMSSVNGMSGMIAEMAEQLAKSGVMIKW